MRPNTTKKKGRPTTTIIKQTNLLNREIFERKDTKHRRLQRRVNNNKKVGPKSPHCRYRYIESPVDY